MAFVVEDGTGVTDANSYASVAYADAYFTDRGNAVWDAIVDDTDKEKYLIQGTDYVETVYARRFIGDMADMAQPLSWPRTDTGNVNFDDTVIPDKLIKAVCEYALRAIDGPLMPDPTIDATGFSVVTTRKAVGPIEKEFKVQGGYSRPRAVRPYPAADLLLISLLRSTGGRVIRA